MLSQPVDLYLGSDMGLWVLDQIESDAVRQAITFDEGIAAKAESHGIRVLRGNANSIPFVPADIGLSVHYPRLLKPHLIAQYRKLYNLHPGYLPWGRGYYPVFWALWERTPAGATLHEITAGIDEGPIVAQVNVEYGVDDTGETLFQRVRMAEKLLFCEYWQRIITGEQLPSFLQTDLGSYHTKQEFFALKQNCDWSNMTAEDLIRLIRCLTFSGYSGLEVRQGNETFHLCFQPLNS
jgi:methionyl-tRNA formyltransferase